MMNACDFYLTIKANNGTLVMKIIKFKCYSTYMITMQFSYLILCFKEQSKVMHISP